ncbi:MAG: C40 family peptidase [Deltaproteobacteria bacterium]|nr:C40 family peptidase [Deltaproteobacteria bacterium]
MSTHGRYLCLLTALALIGSQVLCGCLPLQPIPASETSPRDHFTQPGDHKVIQILHQQARDWKGVPYKYGGLSKQGVDCSGFVQETFRTKFQIKLPRNTYQQSRNGKPVLRDDLKAGDLVFFRLSYNLRHVGIYLENDRFAHASTSKGVTISNLKNSYWSKRYWKARRVLGKR